MRPTSALRTFCWIGAAVDALAVVALLSPAVSGQMLGVDVPATAKLLYAMRTGAALMLGWTLLLVWAALRPLERRGVVFLTVLPVILGLMATEVVAVRGGFVPAANAGPLLGAQTLLGLFGLWAWARATATPGQVG
ncbi:MAG TPA: hypothetical protein VE911_02590 [Candidatus Nitrosopolaris sp.]|nr:hypothetical protein [Candidatus Nitrosopolaris sp.]